MTTFHDMTCIVRSIGERTTELCVKLLERAFSGAIKCTVLEAKPFSEALRQSLSIGLAKARPWTFIVDADVLVSSHALAILPSLADTMPPDGFMLHASVWDKFFCRYRRAGNRLYRTELLEQALPLIPANGSSMRPERDMCYRMQGNGYKMFKSYHIIGLHDYEQYYIDILRKGVLFGLKHTKKNTYLKKIWEPRAHEFDYKAVLDGFNASPNDLPSVSIDKNLINYCSDETICNWKKIEKQLIIQDSWSEEYLTKMIDLDMKKFNIQKNPDIHIMEYT